MPLCETALQEVPGVDRVSNGLLWQRGLVQQSENLVALVSPLMGIPILVGVLGFAAIGFLNATQRRREYLLLKAVGGSSSQIRVLAVVENLFQGLVAMGLGIGVGQLGAAVYSWSLWLVTTTFSFGTLQVPLVLSIPISHIVLMVGSMIGLMMIATLLPFATIKIRPPRPH